jgi:hypothetical protein
MLDGKGRGKPAEVLGDSEKKKMEKINPAFGRGRRGIGT